MYVGALLSSKRSNKSVRHTMNGGGAQLYSYVFLRAGVMDSARSQTPVNTNVITQARAVRCGNFIQYHFRSKSWKQVRRSTPDPYAPCRLHENTVQDRQTLICKTTGHMAWLNTNKHDIDLAWRLCRTYHHLVSNRTIGKLPTKKVAFSARIIYCVQIPERIHGPWRTTMLSFVLGKETSLVLPRQYWPLWSPTRRRY